MTPTDTIDANNVPVSATPISAANEPFVAAPAANAPVKAYTSIRNRLVVPKRVVQGGFDEKFEEDPYNIDLKGIITQSQYISAVKRINDRVKPARSNKFDGFLLATGVLMVPLLSLWGARRYGQAKKRKKLLAEAIYHFNAENPTLYMRWNRKPHSCLTIEKRILEIHGPSLPPPSEPAINSKSNSTQQPYFEYS